MSDRAFKIEGNFVLPAGYRREFRLTVGAATCLVIVTAPSWVEYQWAGDDSSHTAVERSRILDWIQEAIESARADSIPKR